VTAPEGLDGASLASFLDGAVPPRTFAHIQHDERTAVRGLGWKYIAGKEKTRPEAYDLVEDPKETHNHAAEAPGALQALISESQAWYTGVPRQSIPAPPRDAEQRELMDGLGYLNK